MPDGQSGLPDPNVDNQPLDTPVDPSQDTSVNQPSTLAQPDQDNEYNNYLANLGIDPSNPASISTAFQRQEEKINQLSETAASYETALQQLANDQQTARAQAPSPAMQQGTMAPEDAWQEFEKQNPYSVISQTAAQVAQQSAQQAVGEAMIRHALSAEEARLNAKYTPAEKQVIIQAAQQVFTQNPMRYKGAGVSMADSVNAIFRDAEIMAKEQAKTYMNLAGMQPGNTQNQIQVATPQAQSQNQAQFTPRNNAAAAFASAPDQNRPGPVTKTDAELRELNIKKQKAVEDGDIDSVLDAVLRIAEIS